MNINLNYNATNRYSGFSTNNQQSKIASNPAPAFKMSGKVAQSGLVGANLVGAALAAATGVAFNKNNNIEEPQDVTLEKIKDYIKGRKNFHNVEDINDIVNNKPEIINRLLSLKKPDGTQFFDEYEITYSIIDRNIDVLKTEPEKLFAVLENPEELAGMRSPKCNIFKSAMLNWAIKHPLDSTREANPGLFDPEEPISVDSVVKSIINNAADDTFKVKGLKTLYTHPELVSKLASLKDSVGHQYFDSTEIGYFLSNFEPHIDNPKLMDRLNKFIENPKIAKDYGVEDYMSRACGLWEYVINY